jgi:release factor glutamine methyltransferase
VAELIDRGVASIAAALGAATHRLQAAGCDTPRLDAELLLAHVLGCDRAALVREAHRTLAAHEAERLDALVGRRVNREPVAYILGRRGFRHIEVEVDARVLIPRPETELLVEAALELSRGARVADVGTGSGAVALALKHEREDLEVTGLDSSADALAVARANGERLGLDVALRRADLLDGGSYHAVLANLPYVAEADWAGLQLEIVRFEPRTALVAADRGFALIRRLVAALPGDVRLAAFEVGAGQAAEVGDMLVGAGFDDLEIRRDLAGIERVVFARR